ncbi:MAG: prepilin-type N-terminal cleavage/methylation domain-containing protein [bacterium]
MREQGFSLIEILIATLIFTIFALAIFNCINYSYKNVITSRNAEVAINLCQETMESIKKVSYDSVPCPATFTPTWYEKGATYYSGYPTGNFPPTLYFATYTTCTNSNPTMCTATTFLHDHKDLLVTIGVGTQTTNGTKTVFTYWVDDNETTWTTQDYKGIKVLIEWIEGGIIRKREVSTCISKK